MNTNKRTVFVNDFKGYVNATNSKDYKHGLIDVKMAPKAIKPKKPTEPGVEAKLVERVMAKFRGRMLGIFGNYARG